MPDKPAADTINTSLDKLQQHIISIRKAESELEAIAAKLKEQFAEVEQSLPINNEEWHKHREECIKELVQQLASVGIALTTEEQAELSAGGATITSIREKLRKLKELKLELAENSSDFVISIHDAIVSSLSRTLQKIDAKAIKSIIKNLVIISKENENSKKIISNQAKQYDNIIAAAKQLEAKTANIIGLSSEQMSQLKQIEKIIPAQPTTKIAPT